MLLHILATIFIVFALSRVFLRFKKKEMRRIELFFWFIIWILVLVALYIPERFIQDVSQAFGIQRGMDFLIYISIIFLFYMVFRIYAKMDRIEQNLTQIVRNDAINKEDKKK